MASIQLRSILFFSTFCTGSTFLFLAVLAAYMAAGVKTRGIGSDLALSTGARARFFWVVFAKASVRVFVKCRR